MAMGTMSTVAAALSGVNLVLLAALGAVWVRNYRTFKTPLILGLIAFAAVLFVENAVAVYFYLDMGAMLYAKTPTVNNIVATMRILQFVAIAFLTWVTMQ